MNTLEQIIIKKKALSAMKESICKSIKEQIKI